ncbi:MAG: hypothetical protein V3G42_09275 [Oscillospiraceae bacterium]
MKKLYAYMLFLLIFCTGCGTSAPEEVQEPIESIPVTEATPEPEIETTIPDAEAETAVSEIELETNALDEEDTNFVEEEYDRISLHGYNERENTKFTFAGLDFSIPS